MPIDYVLDDKKTHAVAAGPPATAAARQKELAGNFGTLAAAAAAAKDPVAAAHLAVAGHIAEAAESEAVRTHMGSVKNGVFTNKRDQDGVINLNDEGAKALIPSIDDFYAITASLRKKYQDPIAAIGATLTLYRAIATGAAAEYVDILPSSTSLSLAFVKGWAHGKMNYVILEITVPITYPMLIMAYPEAYTGLRYPDAINQAQQEVTVAPSRFTKQAQRSEDGYTIVKVSAAPLDAKDAKAAIAHQVETRGDGVSADDMARFFTKFCNFFKLENLRTKYHRMFEIYAEPERIYCATTYAATKRLIAVSYRGHDDTLDISMDFERATRKISIRMDWEDEKGDPQSQPMVFDARNIGDVRNSLDAGMLQDASEFEYLPLPDRWPKKEDQPSAAAAAQDG